MTDQVTQTKGRFIVFEGIDGAGKTTQIDLLEKSLISSGRKVFRTAEPTNSPVGKMLRSALAGTVQRTACEMASLFLLDRISHNVCKENGIWKMLNDGFDVICDRYYYSSLAYQGSEIDGEWVFRMNLDCPEILHPDLCIFLDLTPEESMARIRKRNETLEIYENIERLSKVRKQFIDVFAKLTDENIKVIHANRAADEIHAEILKIVNALAPSRI